jgi:hypothetical protein
MKTTLALLTLIALTGASALAADGVREINQACATGDGCFSGDAPGFPVTIASPGSYVLTGDLNVPDENTTAIGVTTTFVTINLNGFAIGGVTTCTGTVGGEDFACAPLGTGIGINAPSLALTVRNGYVTHLGDRGVVGGNGSVVEGVHFSHNGGVAVTVGVGAIVRSNTVRMNGGTMIGQDRIAGVSANFTTQVLGNTMQQLDGAGISAAGRVADNTLISIEGDAVIATSGVVEGNEIALATGFGLRASGSTGYVGNVIRGNNSNGDQVSSGVELGTNLCGFNTTCP